MTLKIIEWTAFAAVLALLSVMGGCESPKPQRVETLIDATAERMAEIQADTDWRAAVQEFNAERARQNGWQGWHPPYEPADE